MRAEIRNRSQFEPLKMDIFWYAQYFDILSLEQLERWNWGHLYRYGYSYVTKSSYLIDARILCRNATDQIPFKIRKSDHYKRKGQFSLSGSFGSLVQSNSTSRDFSSIFIGQKMCLDKIYICSVKNSVCALLLWLRKCQTTAILDQRLFCILNSI
jgi:hypothetical protein